MTKIVENHSTQFTALSALKNSLLYCIAVTNCQSHAAPF